jgi:hypothetical protein
VSHAVPTPKERRQMKKQPKPIINPKSRSQLKNLFKTHGLQSWIFDEKALFFEWEGLEYQFYIIEKNIYLEKIAVLKDVIVAHLDSFKSHIQKQKSELPDCLK